MNIFYRLHKNFRHPRTHQEEKAFYGANDSTVVKKIRAKRRPGNLPDAWDDIYVCDRKNETKRQLAKSRKNFRESIRFMIGE